MIFRIMFLRFKLDFGTQDGTWPAHDSREIAPPGVQDRLEDVALISCQPKASCWDDFGSTLVDFGPLFK